MPFSLPCTLAVMLRDRRHFGVAHAGLDRGKGCAHRAVLHRGSALHQLHLFRALDDLDAVDQVGGIDITSPWETARLMQSAIATDI